MNKIVFEVGLLAFCIAAVVFSTEGLPPLDVIARAFLVFMLVELGIGSMLFVASSFSRRGGDSGESDNTQAGRPGTQK